MSQKYNLQEHVKYQIEVDTRQRLLIIPLVSGIPNMTNVLCLADTALEIWKLISDNCSATEIINILCQKYHQEEAVIASDVTSFIDRLIETGFISAEQ